MCFHRVHRNPLTTPNNSSNNLPSILFGMMGNVILAFYTSRYKECQTVVQSFMEHRQIDSDLRKRVNTFFSEAYGTGRNYFGEIFFLLAHFFSFLLGVGGVSIVHIFHSAFC